MNEEILFYHNPKSRGQMTHWMLEEVGAPYKAVILDFAKGEHKSPAFLAVNPMGKVPAIVHRGTVVTETAAIIAYLADAFPERGLSPRADDPLRGAYYRWLFFTAGCFEPALLDRMLKRPPAEPKTAVGYGTYEDVIAVLKKTVSEGPYLLGEKFSAADVYLGAELNWAMIFGAPMIKDDSAFEAYVGRLKNRPAFARTQSDAA